MRKLFQNQYISLGAIILAVFFCASTNCVALTIEDEKKIGREFYDKLEQNNFLLKDRQLNDYVTQIGNLVLRQSRKAPFDFTFSIVDSSAINAFATPGGYIYIHKGLINAVSNEAELAGVIAHEIAHANARHIASIMAKAKKLNLAALAAIIAGAFLGGGAEASAAIAAFSMAGASTMTLKYLREHEEEADRLGISYLTGAGYCPSATVSFLKLIKKHEFLSKSVPSYFRTHPGTDERIFYLDGLVLTKYPETKVTSIVGNLERMKALIPLGPNELNARHIQLTARLAENPTDVDLLYALALTENKMGQTDSALRRLKKALDISPLDRDVLKYTGIFYLKKGNARQARPYLQSASELTQDNDDELTLALGKANFALGNYLTALHNYLKVQDEPLDDVGINYHIAMAYGKLNNSGESHYHFGLHFKKENKTQSALFHFKEAVKHLPAGSARAVSANKEIEELTAKTAPAKPPPAAGKN